MCCTALDHMSQRGWISSLSRTVGHFWKYFTEKDPPISVSVSPPPPPTPECVFYAHRYVQVHIIIHSLRGQRKTSNILIYYLLCYSFEMEPLTEFGARLVEN